MERKQADYSNLVRTPPPPPLPIRPRAPPVALPPFDSPAIRSAGLIWGAWQDERYTIQGERYQGQQYSHIYYTRLHHMRTLLHALVPSRKPNIPGKRNPSISLPSSP